MPMFKHKPWAKKRKPSMMNSNKMRQNILSPWAAAMKRAHRAESFKKLVHVASGRNNMMKRVLSPLRPKNNPIVVLLPKGRNSFEKVTVGGRMKALGTRIATLVKKPFNLRGIMGIHPAQRVKRFQNLQRHLRPMSFKRPTRRQKNNNAARSLLNLRRTA